MYKYKRKFEKIKSYHWVFTNLNNCDTFNSKNWKRYYACDSKVEVNIFDYKKSIISNIGEKNIKCYFYEKNKKPKAIEIEKPKIISTKETEENNIFLLDYFLKMFSRNGKK